jgi:hypothetical protein
MQVLLRTQSPHSRLVDRFTPFRAGLNGQSTPSPNRSADSIVVAGKFQSPIWFRPRCVPFPSALRPLASSCDQGTVGTAPL